MLRKLFVGAAASLCAMVVLPGAAEAGRRDGYYDRLHYDGYDDRGYRHRYRPGDYYRGSRYRRGYGSYGGYGRPYGYGYGGGGYGYGRRYYRGRCGDGTTGAIVGGAAGALVGREVARDGRRYSRHRYRRGGDGTVGAIIGGAIGALVGREINRSC
jgi:hypothetical protein